MHHLPQRGNLTRVGRSPTAHEGSESFFEDLVKEDCIMNDCDGESLIKQQEPIIDDHDPGSTLAVEAPLTCSLSSTLANENSAIVELKAPLTDSLLPDNQSTSIVLPETFRGAEPILPLSSCKKLDLRSPTHHSSFPKRLSNKSQAVSTRKQRLEFEKHDALPLGLFELPESIHTEVEEREAKKPPRPPPYTFITRNSFLVSRPKRKKWREEVHQCLCKPGADGTVCGDDCLCLILLNNCSSDCSCQCFFPKKCSNQAFQLKRQAKLRVTKTEKCGWGIILLEDKAAGDFIVEYVGEVIDDATCEQRLWDLKASGETNFYLCEISRDCVIDASFKGNFSRFVNHSCNPNCALQKWTINGEVRVGIFALGDIKKNTELTYDYQFVGFGSAKTCCCGASNCRGVLGVPPPAKTAANLKRSRPPKGRQPRIASPSPPPVSVSSAASSVVGRRSAPQAEVLQLMPSHEVSGLTETNIIPYQQEVVSFGPLTTRKRKQEQELVREAKQQPEQARRGKPPGKGDKRAVAVRGGNGTEKVVLALECNPESGPEFVRGWKKIWEMKAGYAEGEAKAKGLTRDVMGGEVKENGCPKANGYSMGKAEETGKARESTDMDENVMGEGKPKMEHETEKEGGKNKEKATMKKGAAKGKGHAKGKGEKKRNGVEKGKAEEKGKATEMMDGVVTEEVGPEVEDDGKVKKEKRKQDETTDDDATSIQIGRRVRIWWPLDQKWFHGVIEVYDSARRKHKIQYDDGDTELLTLRNEQWAYSNTTRMERKPNFCLEQIEGRQDWSCYVGCKIRVWSSELHRFQYGSILDLCQPCRGRVVVLLKDAEPQEIDLRTARWERWNECAESCPAFVR
eukprot:TRINITY_DN7585_c1_g2_i4.p1 TRINITY_DN7585_c1_g2~~TRINITY_DN7585_c1_g2_i4.p1  ORF type:complete len:853 (-),score=141.42 TRINITY_DN7585_c1_g2_i4:2511-5069(-)